MLDSPVILALIRLVMGSAFIGLYASIESWLNLVARSERRGCAFSAYIAVNYLCIGSGQWLLNAGYASGIVQLMIVAVLFVAALLPVTLLDGWPSRTADQSLPALAAHSWMSVLKSAQTATPLALSGAIAVGMAYGSFNFMAPVALIGNGFDTAQLSAFMSIASVSSLLWPVGQLSDALNRRALLVSVWC